MSQTWTTLKFIYLYLAYWFAGLEEEDFYVTKSDYFADLGKYHSAIKAYRHALKESEMAFIYANIGWCYTQIDEDETAFQNYRKAFEKIKKLYVILPLAHLEMELGNTGKCREAFQHIGNEYNDLPDDGVAMIERVKDYLEHHKAAN